MRRSEKSVALSFKQFMADFVEKKAGRFVASGAFGEVFVKRNDPSKVFKIGLFDYKDASSDAYLNFIQEVLNKQHNPFFPKIESVQFFHGKYKRKNTSWYVVEMERLAPLNDDYIKRHEKKNSLSSILWRCMSQIATNQRNVRKEIASIKIKIAKKNASERQKKFAKESLDVIRGLIEDNEPDMHLENFMRRGRQLVITDPVSYVRSYWAP